MTRKEWQEQLTLYDEPHGDEYYVVDHSESPPAWYRLDGTAFGHESARSPEEIVRAAIDRGWTPRRLYPCPPPHLEEIFSKYGST